MIEAPNQNPFDLNPHWAVSGLVGTTIHRLLELTFQFLGLSSESEYSVRGGSWAGRVDHILAPTQTGLVKSILDVKQVSEGEFKKGLRTSKLAGFIAQIALYARALNIDHGTVLLVCRNTGKMLELGFDISPELSLAAENRAATIQLAAIARQVPPAEERVNHGGETHVCRLICAYRATCLKEPLE
jgi:hypothetical protein